MDAKMSKAEGPVQVGVQQDRAAATCEPDDLEDDGIVICTTQFLAGCYCLFMLLPRLCINYLFTSTMPRFF